MPPLEPADSWLFLPVGYVLTVAIEIPVLLLCLSRHHRFRTRVAAGFWLTACTYPVVVLVLPYLLWEPYGQVTYLAVAETFAPLAECALFWLAFGSHVETTRRTAIRDFAAIVAANLASFLIGLWLFL